MRHSSSSVPLTPEQERMYASEKEENFRWLLTMLATTSSYKLSPKDTVDPTLQQELSDIGQFAEVAHGSMDPKQIWQYMPQLLETGSPLDGYTYLEGSELISAFYGSTAHLQGYVAYRPEARQLIVAFSGTSSSKQALQDLKFWKSRYASSGEDGRGSTVHAGFLKMYNGIRNEAFRAVSEGVEQKDVLEIVFTGHSMGGVMVYLTVLDLLRSNQQLIRLPFGISIKVVVFGSPRVGNAKLLECWKRRVEAYRHLHGVDKFHEWSVKAYNDGVPVTPPSFLGFRHLTETPMYLHNGTLYHIPAPEHEHSIFEIDHPSAPEESAVAPDYPLGGHNYYGGRDMEKLQRLMKWATEVGLGKDENWKAAFTQKLKDDDEKWIAKHARRKSKTSTA